MKKYIITLLLILAVLISFGQSDPAPTQPANAVSIQGFAKINGLDTVHTGYQSGFGFIDLAGRSWTKKNFASALVPTVVQTANYTAAVHDFVPVNTTSGSVTITLPTKPEDKSLIAVKHVIQGGTNTVTINSGGTDVFNKTGGFTSITLKTLNQGVLLQYSSAGIWYVLSDDLPLSSLDLRYVNSLTSTAASTPTLVNGVLNIPPISSTAGTVTGVSSANSDISVATGTSTPVLTLNSGTGANQIVKRDVSGNLNATTVTTNANLTGPITSVGNATAIANINGITPAYYDPTSSIQTQLNGKQATISLTTTGSGSASLTGSTLNIPTPATTSVANPTSLVGLTAINGTATTAMRSDGAPAINQAIAPNWTNLHTYTQNGIGETPTDALLVQNTTAATLGTFSGTTGRYSNQQDSPDIHLKSSGYSVSASAAKSADFYINAVGAQTSAGGGFFQIMASIGGGTPVQGFTVDQSGNTYLGPSSYTIGSFGCSAITTGTGNMITSSNTYTASGFLFAGANSVQVSTSFGGTNGLDLTASANRVGGAVIIPGRGVYGSGISNVNAFGANLVVNPLAFSAAYPGTSLTNNATLYINGPGTGATNNWPIYVSSGNSYFGGPVSINSTQTVISGSTSGSVTFSMPQQGITIKEIIIYCNNVTGTATYSFPAAFTNTPGIITTSNGPASSVVTAINTTGVTITGSLTTGTIILKSY